MGVELPVLEGRASMSFLNNTPEDQKAIFSLFDSGNGSIDADALANALRTLGFTPSKEELAEFGRGPFDFQSFVDITGRCSTTETQDAAEAFGVFDIHNNGFVSTKDMSLMLKNLGEPFSDSELTAALQAMEPDGEQQINLAFIVQKFLSNN